MEKDESGSSGDPILRLQRPGLTLYHTLAGPVRGLFQLDGVEGGRIFAASGERLVTIENQVGSTDLGDIGDDGAAVVFASTFDKLALISAGSVYTLSDNVLTTLAMPDGVPAVSVTDINNYLIFARADGRFYWLPPGETEIDPLDFATAESGPDGLVSVHRIGDELYFFGSATTEVWQTTGNLDLPFQRMASRNYTRGCLARDTVRTLDNAVVWVGENGVVYRSEGVPTRLSNHGIEERLRLRTGLPSACLVTVDAHEFYVLRVPGQGSFAYDVATSAWSEFSTSGASEWAVDHAVYADSRTLVASSAGGKVWDFDPASYTDDGLPLVRRVTGTIPLSGRPVRNDSIAISVGCSGDCNVELRWRDGGEAFDDNPAILPATAPIDVLTLYRLGMAREPFRTFEITVRDPVQIRISDCRANEAWN